MCISGGLDRCNFCGVSCKILIFDLWAIRLWQHTLLDHRRINLKKN